MAIRYAVLAGSIDTPSNWDGGTLPTSADDVYLNGLAMTAAAGADVSWLSLTNTANASPAIVAGGTLTITGARNFVIGVMNTRTDGATNNGMIQITANTGTVSITGEAQAGVGTNTSHCINRSGNCAFVFNGTVTPRTGSLAFVINVAGTGALTMGSAEAPITLPAAITNLIQINNASIVANIYANQFMGGTSGSALTVTLCSVLNSFGPCFGGSASSRFGISLAAVAAMVVNHTGDCYAGTGGSTPAGISKGNAGTLNLFGKLISSTVYNLGNAVSVLGGTFNLNTDTPRDIELGPVSPLVFTNSIATCNIFVNQINRVTQANVAAISGAWNGSLTVTQQIAGGTAGTGSQAITLSGTNTINALGGIRGGGTASCAGITIPATTGTQTINGNAVGADFSSAHAIAVTGVGTTVIVNGKVTGNGYGVGSAIAGPAAGISVTALATVSVREVESGPRGQSGIIGPVLMIPSPLNKSTYRQAVNGATTELVPASGGIQSYGFID